jgi:outer membrane immunogenic protein
MKRLLVPAALLSSLHAAQAADLPTRGSPPPVFITPPALLFQGFYVGAQAGALGFGDRTQEFSASNNASLARTTARSGSFIGGVHAGYDWRVGLLVLGLVGDVSGARAVNNAYDPFRVAIHNELGVQGSLRGRVGYAFNRLFIYATGGLNVADVRHDYRSALVSGLRHSVVGEPTVGVGAEYALTDRWSGRVEYRLSGVGTPRETSPILPSTIVRHDAGAGAITAGVSYHFGP